MGEQIIDADTEAAEYAVLDAAGHPVGLIAVDDAHRAACHDALAGAGYRVTEVEDEASAPAIHLDAECTLDDHEPCDLATGIGVAAEVAEELQLPSHGRLQAIVDSGVVSRQEARAVLNQWAAEVRSAPGADEDALGWADVVESEVSPGNPIHRGVG